MLEFKLSNIKTIKGVNTIDVIMELISELCYSAWCLKKLTLSMMNLNHEKLWFALGDALKTKIHL